jgi:allatostatin receptor
MDEQAFHEQFLRLAALNFTLDPFNGTFPFPSEETDVFYAVLDRIIVPFLFGFVTLTGVIGNSLVIYVICRKRKMRTLTNLLLMSLAFADLSFVLVCPPFTAYESAAYHWPFRGVGGDVLCRLMHYLLNVTAYVTIYTLVAIAALRYFTIVHNAATVKYRTKSVICLLICGIWLSMLVLNIPILLSYGVYEDPHYFDLPFCKSAGPEFGKRLYATFFVFAYLLPLAIIGIFSLGILQHINGAKSVYVSRSEVRKRHASRLVISVVLIFAIFWFPVHIHLLMVYFSSVPDTKFYNTLHVLFQFLAYFNSCINPLIYDSTSKDFRTAFREAVCRTQPETSDQTIPLTHKPMQEINANTKETQPPPTHEEDVNNSPTSARSVSV